MKACTASLVIRKIQIKSTILYDYTFPRRIKMKKYIRLDYMKLQFLQVRSSQISTISYILIYAKY